MIGYTEIKKLEESGIIEDVAEAPFEQKDDVLRHWWLTHGVDYAGVERWAIEQSIDDLKNAFLQFGRLLGPDEVGAMLATSWDMGVMMGFRLAVEATHGERNGRKGAR